MNFIPLTKIEKILNDDAESRLQNMRKEADRLSKLANADSEGEVQEGSYEWYMKLNIKPPDDVFPTEIPSELTINFHIDNDYDTYYSDILLDSSWVEEFERWQEKKDWTIVYLKSGREITVKEGLEQIKKLLT